MRQIARNWFTEIPENGMRLLFSVEICGTIFLSKSYKTQYNEDAIGKRGRYAQNEGIVGKFWQFCRRRFPTKMRLLYHH
jgi:hypothetical protein